MSVWRTVLRPYMTRRTHLMHGTSFKVGTAGYWAWSERVAEMATSAVRGDTHGKDLDVGVMLRVLVVMR